MTSEQQSLLAYTVAHFQEVARQNRFAENGRIAHDTHRCVICHPERLPLDPFVIYLEVVTESIKVRRPVLDAALVEEINKDIALMGASAQVSVESLRAGEEAAMGYWSGWVDDAMNTGLALLAVHSPSSHEFDLEEAEIQGWGTLVEEKVRELMDYQLRSLDAGDPTRLPG